MSFFDPRTLPGLALLIAMAPAAQADVTAQDVWNDWQAYFTGLGYEVTADEAMSGDTLTISEIVLTSPEQSEAGSMVMRLEEIRFAQQGDGSVAIIFPDVMPMEVRTVDADGSTAEMTFEMRPNDMATVVSGVPTEMTTTYTAESVETQMTSLTVDGEAMSAEDAVMTMAINDLSGTSVSTVGGKRGYDQQIEAADVTYRVAFTDPDGGGTVDLEGQVDTLSFDGGGALPLAVVGSADMGELLSAGLSMAGTFAYASGATTMSVTEGGADSFAAQSSSNGGTLDVAMDTDGATYSGTQEDLQVSVNASDLPVPVDFAMDDARFNITMPVQQSEEAGDFALGFAFNDFTMSDVLWGMFDPGQQLPRDPATVILDLTGKARLLFDFLDPSAAMAPGGSPAEIETLDINQLRIALAGAELTGDGAFSFDNSAAMGLPKPVGQADLSLSGGNALLDKLVAMGLLPEDQAMGARMMMGLLAVPGEAPDTLSSKIEINAEGHVLANGQRIQ